MTTEEENDLRALGNELSGALQSPWEPRCVARAFATPLEGDVPFTMQMWIDLDAVHSPLLQGEIAAKLEDLEIALDILGLNGDDLTAEEELILEKRAILAIGAAFAMGLPMRPEAQSDRGGEGFGEWLPIFTFLLTDCHLSIAEARALPVGQTFALLAARRHNQGWQTADTAYALRDMDCRPSVPDGNSAPASDTDALQP